MGLIINNYQYLQYLTKEELRVLIAVEMGMKNHEYVPDYLIEKISKLKRANTYKVLQNLLKNKLVTHQKKKCFFYHRIFQIQDNGYKLTYLGYDFLALSVFFKRGTVVKVIGKVGVGKESDIYKCLDQHGNEVILKLARLGRISFMTVKKNRDYLRGRNCQNWLYISRLASLKEFTYMEILYKHQFPTPVPKDWNRHGIVMSYIQGYTLCNVQMIDTAEELFKQGINLLERFAQHGLIHSDLNEFNLMIDQTMNLRVIDFPQMVSTTHLNADFYFDRDLECLNTFFQKRFKCDLTANLKLKDINVTQHLDIEVKASGYLKKELTNINELDILDDYHAQNQNKNENFQNEENQINQEDSDEQEDQQDENQDVEDKDFHQLEEENEEDELQNIDQKDDHNEDNEQVVDNDEEEKAEDEDEENQEESDNNEEDEELQNEKQQYKKGVKTEVKQAIDNQTVGQEQLKEEEQKNQSKEQICNIYLEKIHLTRTHISRETIHQESGEVKASKIEHWQKELEQNQRSGY